MSPLPPPALVSPAPGINCPRNTKLIRKRVFESRRDGRYAVKLNSCLLSLATSGRWRISLVWKGWRISGRRSPQFPSKTDPFSIPFGVNQAAKTRRRRKKNSRKRQEEIDSLQRSTPKPFPGLFLRLLRFFAAIIAHPNTLPTSRHAPGCGADGLGGGFRIWRDVRSSSLLRHSPPQARNCPSQ